MNKISYNDNILEVKNTILNEKDFFKNVTPDEMMIFIEEHFKTHSDMHNRTYCKNIKIYSLGFTREQENKLFNERVMSAIWDFIIMPSIADYEKKEYCHIYQMGRSGGWLYIDDVSVLDFDKFGPREEDEEDYDYEDRMSTLQGVFEKLWPFEKWFNQTLEEVKEYLDYDVDLKEVEKDEQCDNQQRSI